MRKSTLLIAVLTAFVVGIFMGDFVKIEFAWLLGILIGLIIALIIFYKELYWRLAFFILIGLIVGAGYFRTWDNRQKAVNLPYNQEISFEGQIIGHPDFLSNGARYVVNYQNTKIQVSSGLFPDYHYGDVLNIKGTLKAPNDYLFHQGILGMIYNPEKIEKIGTSGNKLTKTVYFIRDKFEESLNKTLAEPLASFAAGLVLGSKRNIPDSLMSDFNRTGTTHIVAVSGYNVTIIIVNIGILLGILSRKLKFWGSLVIILGFVVMTGAPASVVRAGLLAGLIAWGHFEGRRINMTILLLLVASLMLLFNPYALKYDLSFELSFLAFAGLVYLSPSITKLRIIKSLPKILKLTLAETLGAQIMVLPILIYSFGLVSLVSPIVNILVLWLIPSAMLLIFAVGIGGLIWINFGKAIGIIAWAFLNYIIIVVENFSKMPWAAFNLKITSWWWMILFYSILFLWFYRGRENQKEPNEFFKA